MVDAELVLGCSGTDGKSPDLQAIRHAGRTAADANRTTLAGLAGIYLYWYAFGLRALRWSRFRTSAEGATEHRGICRSGGRGESIGILPSMAGGL